MILGQNRKMFSFVSFLADLWADPFPFMIACSRGAGVGVEGVDTAAACLRVLTPADILQSLIGLYSRGSHW